jgi:protein-S-isoprenylcysteine O-methyltransferase Ste14
MHRRHRRFRSLFSPCSDIPVDKIDPQTEDGRVMIVDRQRVYAYLLVSVQFFCIGLILVSGGPSARALPLLVMEIAGIVLGIWAFAVMGWRNMNVSPLVRRGARLVTTGPYAAIRHPMYTAVLLTLWALIVDRCTLFRLGVGLVLTVDLLLKIWYEESLLKRQFPEYAAYRERTKRLIPFIF